MGYIEGLLHNEALVKLIRPPEFYVKDSSKQGVKDLILKEIAKVKDAHPDSKIFFFHGNNSDDLDDGIKSCHIPGSDNLLYYGWYAFVVVQSDRFLMYEFPDKYVERQFTECSSSVQQFIERTGEGWELKIHEGGENARSD